MDNRKEFFRITYLILFIFVVNLLAIKLYWYSLIWYFDMPMHFLGGFWVGLVLLWLMKPGKLSSGVLWGVFFGVLLVGVGWEVFEFLVDRHVGPIGFNFLDATSDIFFDLSGGFAAASYHFRKNASIVII